MTENKINITDMIKALQCVASQDAEGDCYCDHFNFHLTCEQFDHETRLDEKHMSCGGNLKDTQNCPYHQNTYGVCFEDGELYWLEDIVDMLKELEAYRAIGTIDEFKALKENERKCEDCAGCTNWLCDCANERAKAIDELKKRFRADFEEMMANNMEDCINWADWLDTIAEEMRGAE